MQLHLAHTKLIFLNNIYNPFLYSMPYGNITLLIPIYPSKKQNYTYKPLWTFLLETLYVYLQLNKI